MEASKKNNDYNELLQSFPADDYCMKKNVDGNNQPTETTTRTGNINSTKKMKIDFTRINSTSNLPVAFNWYSWLIIGETNVMQWQNIKMCNKQTPLAQPCSGMKCN